MHSLVVLSDQPRWDGYGSIVFPLYKWKSLLKNHGINLRVTTDKNDKYLKNADTAIIISRVFADGWQNIEKRNNQNETELIDYLTDLKKTVKKLVWYDRSDPSGSTDFPIIQYVDVFLKNQILKDLNYYAQDHGARSVRQWLTSTDNVQAHSKKYYPCPANQLYKIKLGWNIIHSDHRVFKVKGKQRIISNYFFAAPKMYSPSITRRLDFSLRGSFVYGSSNGVSAQRNKVITVLKEITKYKSLVSGERVDKAAFMKEIAESKVCVSPFGWGEVCYRDFEIFIAGALMIKPSLNHFITFPDVFIENETYIPVSWGMDDLKQKLEEVIDNYTNYIHIAKNGQNTFINAITDGEAFVQHINNI